MVEYTKGVSGYGTSNFMRNIMIPMAEFLESQNDNIPSTNESIIEGNPSSPRADIAYISGLLVVGGFVSTWAITKLLDEAYTSYLRPKIFEVMSNLPKESTGSRYGFSLIVKDREKNNSIMLVSIGRTSEDVSDGEALFDKVHSFAIKQVRAIEHENKVLMYCIEDGKFNVEPLMFDSHLEAHGYLTEIRNNSENLS